MDKATKAKAALDRIFDRCEEIDNEDGYSMLDDIRVVSGYIDGQRKPVEWELVYHDDNPAYYAKYVTARCARCGTWYGEIDEDHGQKYGKRLASAFCMNYHSSHARLLMGMELMADAETMVKELPNFCSHCGARMKGSRRNYDSYVRDEK